MKVTLLATRYYRIGSGISTYTYEMYNALKKYSNLDLEFIAQREYFRKLPFIRKGYTNMLNWWLWSTFDLKPDDFNGKNVHSLSVGPFPMRYIDKPRRKIITVQDNFFLFRPQGVNLKRFVFLKTVGKNFLENYAKLDSYDHIIATSELIRDAIIDFMDINPDKVSVAYIMAGEKFRPLKKLRSLRNQKKCVIGYINTFSPNKAPKLREFIRIFKTIKDDSLEMRIYGPPPFPFDNLVKDDTRIKYFGLLLDENKMVEEYNSFDVYLCTSTVEPFGVPQILAKACKIPVLSYDGNIPAITKGNTLIWNEENLAEIIKNRKWKTINVNKAYADAEKCRPKAVVNNLSKIYQMVFQ